MACHWERRGERVLLAKPWGSHLLNPLPCVSGGMNPIPLVQAYFFISCAHFTLASVCTPWGRTPKHMVGKLKTSNQLALHSDLRAPGAAGWPSLEGFSVAFTLTWARISSPQSLDWCLEGHWPTLVMHCPPGPHLQPRPWGALSPLPAHLFPLCGMGEMQGSVSRRSRP